MKLTIEASASTIRKLDALCKYWSKVRAEHNARNPGDKPVPPMTREEWLEIHIGLEHEENVGRRRR